MFISCMRFQISLRFAYQSTDSLRWRVSQWSSRNDWSSFFLLPRCSEMLEFWEASWWFCIILLPIKKKIQHTHTHTYIHIYMCMKFCLYFMTRIHYCWIIFGLTLDNLFWGHNLFPCLYCLMTKSIVLLLLWTDFSQSVIIFNWYWIAITWFICQCCHSDNSFPHTIFLGIFSITETGK